MRGLVLSSLIVASAFVFMAPADAASPKMHSARVMMGHVAGPHGGYYEVMMNGKAYAMIPMNNYNNLLQNCKAKNQC